MSTAAARTRSPLELPPRTPGHEKAASRVSKPARPPRDQMRRKPISLGVLLLALGVTCFMSFSLSAVMFRNIVVRSELASEATEQRLSHELSQLRASTSALQAQLDLRTHDIAAQAEEIEGLSAQLEAMRDVANASGRGVRARPPKRALSMR